MAIGNSISLQADKHSSRLCFSPTPLFCDLLHKRAYNLILMQNYDSTLSRKNRLDLIGVKTSIQPRRVAHQMKVLLTSAKCTTFIYLSFI